MAFGALFYGLSAFQGGVSLTPTPLLERVEAFLKGQKSSDESLLEAGVQRDGPGLCVWAKVAGDGAALKILQGLERLACLTRFSVEKTSAGGRPALLVRVSLVELCLKS